MAKTEFGYSQFALAAPELYSDPQVTGATTEAAAAGHEKVFPPFNTETFASQLIWLALTFGIFYWLMTKVALPRLANIIETRRDRIANDMEEAERFKAKTDEAISSYEKALADARANAMTIATTAREEAKQALDAEKAETDKAINARIADAESSIADMKAAALAEVDSIAAEVTQSIVAKLIDEKITKTDAKKAVMQLKDASNA